MSEQGTQQEPSMEEILASIRRIISEDGDEEGAEGANASNDEAAAAEAPAEAAADVAAEEAPAPEPAVEEEATPIEDLMVADDDGEEDDVLELTDIAEMEPEPEPEPEPEVAAAPEPEPEPEPEPVPAAEPAEDDPFDTGEDSDLMAIDRTPEPEPEPEPAPAPVVAPEPMPIANTAPTPEPSSLMSAEATAAASAAFDRLSADMRVSGDGESGTLEGLVQDLLRPMMKAWLDDNLPAIVEAAVAEEVERVGRRRRR